MSSFHTASLGPASTTSVVWCVRAWLSFCESGSGVHDQRGLVRPGLAFILRIWVRRPRPAWSGASGPGFHTARLGLASTTSVVWCVRAWFSYCESGSGVHDQRGLVRPGPAFILAPGLFHNTQIHATRRNCVCRCFNIITNNNI